MSPNPLILAKGAGAVKAATAGAAKGAAKIAISDKAAKAVGSAFKSMEETTKLGGFQALENFSNNVKNSKPAADAMSILSAQFTAGTMGSRIDLMKDLIELIQSDSFQTVLNVCIDLVNALVDATGFIIDVFRVIGDFLARERGENDVMGYGHPDVGQNDTTATDDYGGYHPGGVGIPQTTSTTVTAPYTGGGGQYVEDDGF